MVPERSTAVLRSWLSRRDAGFLAQVQVVSMDGFTGYASAMDETLPSAVKVMNPFHVVHLAAGRLTGRRGRRKDPFYKHRRALLTRTRLLTDRQKHHLEMLWAADDDYVELQVNWSFYHQINAAYGNPNKAEGKN